MRPLRVWILLAAALLTSCVTVPRSAPQSASSTESPTAPQPARFKILQVNDVYKIEGLEGGMSGGLARVRTLRKHLESDGTPVLVLHAGDALYPSVMSKYLDAKPMVEVLNLLDGDAAAEDPHLILTFGNHEFDNKDPNVLLGRLRESRFQWVATNTFYCATPQNCTQTFGAVSPAVKETIVVDAGGTRVGIFGILYDIPVSERKPYMSIAPVEAAARRAVEALRAQGARVIIGVTHQPMQDDRQLVQNVPGIDILIGGHEHLYASERLASTWITKADADAKSAIVYDVTVAGSAVLTTPVRMTLDATLPKDPEVDRVVQTKLAELSRKLGGICAIGQTKNVLEGVEPAVRGRETALGNLLADVIKETMKTDIAFLNGGGIRINDDIPPGPITNYDLEGVFFYNNNLVSFPLKGSEVREILEHSIEFADAGEGRFLQVSGLRFTYKKTGDRFDVDQIWINNEPIDPAKTYTAATVDFLYDGEKRDGYEIFSTGRRPPEIARVKDHMTLTRNYIRAAGTVETDVEGRIVRLAGAQTIAAEPCK
jgi:5'-nucleotidase